MRISVVLVCLALASVSCGTGSDEARPAPETVTVTSPPSGEPTTDSSTTPEVDQFAPNVGDRALTVGEKRVGRGVVTTLLEVRNPFPPELYREPSRGMQYLGLRIRTCVKDDGEVTDSSFNGEWYAATRSGDQYTSGDSYTDWPMPKYPEFVTQGPGECLKGWMAIEVPRGLKNVDRMIYRTGGTTIAEWNL